MWRPALGDTRRVGQDDDAPAGAAAVLGGSSGVAVGVWLSEKDGAKNATSKDAPNRPVPLILRATGGSSSHSCSGGGATEDEMEGLVEVNAAYPDLVNRLKVLGCKDLGGCAGSDDPACVEEQ